MKKQIKMLTSLLLVTAIMLSTFCFAPLTAQAETIDLYCLQLPRASDSNQDNWGHKAIDFMGGWKNKANDIWLAYAVGSYNGKASYCIEPGVGVASGDSLTKKDENFWDNYPSKYNSTIKPAVMRAIIGRILQYGYTGNLSTSWNSKTDADDIANYLATQLLIWETVVGERDGEFSHIDATKSGYDNTFSMIYKSHPLYDEIKSNYDRIVKSVKNHTVKPSFMTGSTSSATTKEMTWDGSKYTVTLTDSNEVLSNFNFSSNDSAMKFSVSGNRLTITTTKAPTSALSITASSKHYRKGVVTWSDGEISPASNGVQDVVTYAATVTDPTYAYLNLKVSTGNIKLTKTAEDGNVSGLKFRITQSSFDYDKTFTTDSKGVINATNLMAGYTYTVTEASTPSKYVEPKSQTITVVSGQTSTVSFNNVLKKFRVNVTKKDVETTSSQGDASLAGAVYGIYHNKELVDKFTTDSKGQFTTGYYTCGSGWTVKEIAPSAGYNLDNTTYSVGASAKDYTLEYNDTSVDVNEQVIKGKVSIIKHTDDGSTQIETPEKGAGFQIHLKSAGSFVNAKDNEKDTMICDEDGFASSKLLPYGVYTVHQTKGWDGRELIADFDVFIQSESKTYKYLINNANFYSYLKVVKKDAETGKVVAYEGAGFEIYDTDGHRVSMKYTYPEVTTIHTFYTNSEGYLITPEKLPYGDYTLVEVEAPYGYILDTTPIKFSINQDNTSTDTGVTVVKVTAKDVAQKGVIEITKTGEVFSSVEKNNDRYTPKYEEQNLKNAVFEVYANEDITTADGTIRAEKGALVDTVTTDDKGITKSKELYLGKYTVVEKTAPNTFVNSNEKYDVELSYADQHITVTSTSLSVYNQRQKVKISLSKLLEKDETFDIGNNDEIKSVRFGVFANEDIFANDGTTIPKDGLITTANCDEKGEITFDCDLPIGFKFYVKEINADNQYIIDDTKYEFDTEYQGQDKEIININFKDIENKIIRGTVKGLKIDRETNQPIENVEFGLYKSGTTEYTKENAILTAKTDKNGIFVFNSIPYGEYTIKELETAKGYILSDEIYSLSITNNEQVIETTAINDKIPELKTTAKINGKKEVYAEKELTIIDTVEYKHLIVGQEYVIKGILMDKSTGKAFKVNGENITSEVSFTPTSPNRSIDIQFVFDGSNIKKTTDLVVFETLYKDDVELTTHADINDDGQTVKVKIKMPGGTSPHTGAPTFILGFIAFLVGGLVAFIILKRKADK